MTDGAQAHAAPAVIAKKAGGALRWSLLAGMSTKVASFGMGLVLARLLAPSDFGLYAIALAATGFVMHVNDVGLIAATVQWRGRLREVAPTASTMALTFSLVIYGIFWIGAPAFAELAGNPDAAPVVRVLTAVIVVDGIIAIRVAALQRHFRQNWIAIASMVGFAANAPVAITLAASGAGAYAFAYGQLTQEIVTGIIVLAAARLPVRLGLDLAVARKLLGYGIPLAASLGVEALLLNSDYVVVGRLLGATLLGYYLLAFNISSWVANTLGTAIRYVSVAGFSRLAEQDGALSPGVCQALRALLALVLPIAAMFAVLATPLVTFLYGDRWEPAAPVLRWLMLLAVIRLVAGLMLDVLMATASTRAALWVNLAWALALIPALIGGTTVGGIAGAALAHVVVGLCVALPVSILALRKAGVDVTPVGRSLVRLLLAAAAAGLATAAAAWPWGTPFVQLALGGLAGACVYIALAFSPQQILGTARKLSRRARSRDLVTAPERS